MIISDDRPIFKDKDGLVSVYKPKPDRHYRRNNYLLITVPKEDVFMKSFIWSESLWNIERYKKYQIGGSHPGFWNWLSKRDCIVTGEKIGITIHHILGQNPNGTKNNRLIVPIVDFAHNNGKYAYHRCSEKVYKSHWGLKCDNLIDWFIEQNHLLLERYQEHERKMK